ncbi:ABC transporter ATP-binding protein [bacterium]|nr:MAG: ABC transporter ATP-binding protein [bacterium]
MSAALLEVRALYAGYGELEVLQGVDVRVGAGELVAVLGANGAGKTTLLRAISKVEATPRSGSVVFDGVDLAGLAPQRIVALGLSQIPEGRQLFGELSVEDNLMLGAYRRERGARAESLNRAYELFPSLRARRNHSAASLSGGEQQMLAIGRALMARPRVLMLDEPSTGLAPRVVEQIFTILTRLRSAGTGILLVEQNAFLALRHADRAYVMAHGSVALEGEARTLAADESVRRIYLGAALDEEQTNGKDVT